MAKGLKFQIKKVQGLYYLCNENQGVDQLCGYHTDDLRLCFHICKKQVFSHYFHSGITPQWEITRTRKKNTGQLFSLRNSHKISRLVFISLFNSYRSHKKCDAHMHAQAKSNMPLKLSWGREDHWR